jgi:hypothetical protein
MITGKVDVRCPACSTAQVAELVQSLNTRDQPAMVQRLLAGELNVLTCIACGKRTPLTVTMLFHDPARSFYCQVVPGDLAQAIAAFRASGAKGTQRIVRTQNALVEKVVILEAGLLDWAIELAKLEVDDRPIPHSAQVLVRHLRRAGACFRSSKLTKTLAEVAPRGSRADICVGSMSP